VNKKQVEISEIQSLVDERAVYTNLEKLSVYTKIGIRSHETSLSSVAVGSHCGLQQWCSVQK
jgi:hypothetical protein